MGLQEERQKLFDDFMKEDSAIDEMEERNTRSLGLDSEYDLERRKLWQKYQKKLLELNKKYDIGFEAKEE